MKPQFITQNELSREAGIPVSRITAAVEGGIIVPAGRAGTHKHSPVIFLREDVPGLVATLTTNTAKACATTRGGHSCTSPSEVLEKAAALAKAQEEAKQ
jgi:hypothetical protein